MSIKIFFVFVLSCSAAYFFTDNSYSPVGNRVPSSTQVKETRNGYSNLPCPTEQEFMKWSAELNITPFEGPSLDEGCKTKSMRSQLAQILALSKEIKINFPKNWAPSVREEIKNSYDYIKNNTKILKVDLTQVNSVARNYRAIKQIELGGMFFKEEPLEALSVLIHEARHSDARDPGHTTCRIGDIPKTQGGCDNSFSNKAEDAGAYGYGTLYELALAQYSYDLDRAERELMLANAFTGLSTRFNNFRSVLAKHSDIATVLLEDGTLAWVHPYSFELISLKVELPKFQEKIKKIEFSPRTNSLILFTESDRQFVWGPRYKTNRLSPEALSEDDRFLHISRQYIPYETDLTLYTTLKTNGQLEYIRYSPELNKQIILPYPLHPSREEPNPTVPNLKYFALAHSFASYFIDKQGVISRAHMYGNEPNFIIDPSLQSTTGGWKHATGGVFYDDLFLTDSDGKLYSFSPVFKTHDDGEDLVSYKREPAKFQALNRTKKYHQGLQIHAVLDEDGSMSLENYRVPNSRINLKFNKKIMDIVVTRTTMPESSIYTPRDVNARLVKKCRIKKVIETIAYGAILGLDHNGYLVSANPDNTCKDLSPVKWSSAEIKGDDAGGENWDEKRPYPDVYLKLSSQNEKENWIPYTKFPGY